MNNILTVNNLTKVYKGKAAINDVSFNIKKGEVIGLVGPNGAGKTTLMKIIVNIIQKYKGEITFSNSNTRKRRIGCIIENPCFYPNLSGLDNLRYFAEFSGGYNESEVNEIIEMMKIDGFINKKVKNYSLGMKQRLGIAQALLNSPDLLILDEPTNGLDPEGVVEIRNIIKDIVKTRQISVLISSHILSEIQIICDRVLFLKNGNLIKTIDLKQDSSGNLQYKIETKSPKDLEIFFLNSRIPVLKTEGNSIIFETNKDCIEDLIFKIANNNLKFSAIYPLQENLESQFFELLGGNKIG